MNAIPNFRELYTFEQRYEQSKHVLSKYPNSVPIIVQGDVSLKKHKYLVPSGLTIGHFMASVRKQLNCPLNSQQGLVFSCGTHFPNAHELISVVFNNYRDKDGFLYMDIHVENTFGYSN